MSNHKKYIEDTKHERELAIKEIQKAREVITKNERIIIDKRKLITAYNTILENLGVDVSKTLEETQETNVKPNDNNAYDHTISWANKWQYALGEIKTLSTTKEVAHTNSLEGFWSLLKRGVIGTFHVVSPQHLQKYCDEFAYRYNHRNSTTDERFNDTIKRFDSAQITYAKLTDSKKK